MTRSGREAGLRAEEEAARLLEAFGMKVVARNWRCPMGELDLVAEDDGTLVFVEVKARSGSSFGPPEEAVTASKRRKLVRAASAYLKTLKEEPACRFDVVVFEAGRPRHIPDAFTAD